MTMDIFIHTDASASAGEAQGPLAGKRIALQSNLSVREWPAEAGSRALARYRALEDATVVERLKQAGARIAGSVAMSELGLGLNGNAAGRAVAEDCADAALITDMMGEARIAAAASGLIGFKPSYGILSRFGLIGLVPSMECIGIIAESPEEIMAVLEAAAGADDRDFSMSPEIPPVGGFNEVKPSKTTVGVIRQAVDLLDPAGSEAFKEAVSQLEAAGFAVREISLEDFGLFRTVHHIIGAVEASSSAGKYDGVRYGHRAGGAKNWNDMYLRSRAESFGTLVKSYLFQGAYFQFENYEVFENACRIRSRLHKRAAALFDDLDFLVLPTATGPVPELEPATIDVLYDFCACALPANVTGQPAVSLPAELIGGKGGISVQFIAGHLNDGALLSLARHLLHSRKGGIA